MALKAAAVKVGSNAAVRLCDHVVHALEVHNACDEMISEGSPINRSGEDPVVSSLTNVSDLKGRYVMLTKRGFEQTVANDSKST
jgi:hypothetical protein